MVFLLKVALMAGFAVILLLLNFAVFIADFLFSSLEFLFSNWIAQTLFGSWIVFEFQRRGKLAQEKKDAKEERHKAMREIHGEMFQLVDSRLSASQIYLDTLANYPIESIGEARANYAANVHNWNTYGPRRLSDSIQYFPGSLVYRFEDDLYSNFPVLEQWLRYLRSEKENGREIDEIQEKTQSIIFTLHTSRNEFSNQFLSSINKENTLTLTLRDAHEGWQTKDLFKVLLGIHNQ